MFFFFSNVNLVDELIESMEESLYYFKENIR